MVKTQIGFYGGSFDPPHLGHMNLAVQMMEIHRLDEIWFCPAAMNPHKEQGSFSEAKHRVEMLNIAIASEPRFRVIDVELLRQGPSYTIDTLNELIDFQKKKNQPTDFSVIIGDDTARSFYTWHQPEEIIKKAKVLVGKRDKSSFNESFLGSPAIHQAIVKGLTQMHVMEISSTEIRQRLANHQSCWHLLPAKVLDYILAHHLYF